MCGATVDTVFEPKILQSWVRVPFIPAVGFLLVVVGLCRFALRVLVLAGALTSAVGQLLWLLWLIHWTKNKPGTADQSTEAEIWLEVCCCILTITTDIFLLVRREFILVSLYAAF